MFSLYPSSLSLPILQHNFISADDGCCTAASYPSICRMFTGGGDPFRFLDPKKVMNPDIYDPEVSAMCRRFKFHGIVVDPYTRPKPFTHWNLLADPELEKRTKYFNSM